MNEVRKIDIYTSSNGDFVHYNSSMGYKIKVDDILQKVTIFDHLGNTHKEYIGFRYIKG